jgi:hypothetical protein
LAAVTSGLRAFPAGPPAVILSLQMHGGVSCMLPICRSATVTFSFLMCSADVSGAPPVANGISPTVALSRRHMIDTGFVASRVRLLVMIHNGTLIAESRHAYARGIGVAGRAGAAGPVPGVLAEVRMLDPESRPGVVVLPLRWEAKNLTGSPQAVLDADLTVRSARGGRTVLAVDGVFRLPFGWTGPAHDTGISLLRLAAETAAARLLTAVAEVLASPS